MKFADEFRDPAARRRNDWPGWRRSYGPGIFGSSALLAIRARMALGCEGPVPFDGLLSDPSAGVTLDTLLHGSGVEKDGALDEHRAALRALAATRTLVLVSSLVTADMQKFGGYSEAPYMYEAEGDQSRYAHSGP